MRSGQPRRPPQDWPRSRPGDCPAAWGQACAATRLGPFRHGARECAAYGLRAVRVGEALHPGPAGSSPSAGHWVHAGTLATGAGFAEHGGVAEAQAAGSAAASSGPVQLVAPGGRLRCPWCPATAAHERGFISHIGLAHGGVELTPETCAALTTLGRAACPSCGHLRTTVGVSAR
eukprot:7342308-Lingulodinium_polyedra.AAC.1